MEMQNNGWMWIRAAWKLVFMVAAMWAGGARAQWLPAPAKVNCYTMYGSGAVLFPTRTIPSPVVAGEPYVVERYVGGAALEYYFEIVGSELRLNLRTRQLFLQFEEYCYRFTAPPALLSTSISKLAVYDYGRLNDTPPFLYSTPTGIPTFPITVTRASEPVPSNGTVALFALVALVLALTRKKLRSVFVVALCYLIAPPLWRIHINS
jgi:hypothetical protein